MTAGLVHEMLAMLRERGAIPPEQMRDPEIADRVVRHMAMVDRALVDRLGARADTHAAALRLRNRAELLRTHREASREPDIIDRLTAAPDREVAAAASAYRRAESARLDGFGDASFALAELDTATAAPLAWTIAAALRAEPTAAADDDLLGAIAALLEDLPGADAALTAASALVRSAAAARPDRAALASEAIASGWLVLAAATLGAIAGLDGDRAMQTLLDGEPITVAALVRCACHDDRAAAARLLLALARARHGDEDHVGRAVTGLLDDYDALDGTAAATILTGLRVPVAYRQASAAFAREER